MFLSLELLCVLINLSPFDKGTPEKLQLLCKIRLHCRWFMSIFWALTLQYCLVPLCPLNWDSIQVHEKCLHFFFFFFVQNYMLSSSIASIKFAWNFACSNIFFFFLENIVKWFSSWLWIWASNNQFCHLLWKTELRNFINCCKWFANVISATCQQRSKCRLKNITQTFYDLLQLVKQQKMPRSQQQRKKTSNLWIYLCHGICHKLNILSLLLSLTRGQQLQILHEFNAMIWNEFELLEWRRTDNWRWYECYNVPTIQILFYYRSRETNIKNARKELHQF